jgi:cytochrome b561
MTPPSIPSKASLPIRGLHWIMALLVISAWAFIYSKNLFVKGSPTRGTLEQIHIIVGLSLFVLIPFRIIARCLSPLPEIIPAPGHWQTMLAKLMHLLLYACMIVLPILGVLFVQAQDKTVSVPGLFTLPTLIGTDKPLARSIKDIHETIGLGMLYLAIAHAGAALLHHIFQRDNTLKRML